MYYLLFNTIKIHAFARIKKEFKKKGTVDIFSESCLVGRFHWIFWRCFSICSFRILYWPIVHFEFYIVLQFFFKVFAADALLAFVFSVFVCKQFYLRFELINLGSIIFEFKFGRFIFGLQFQIFQLKLCQFILECFPMKIFCLKWCYSLSLTFFIHCWRRSIFLPKNSFTG